MKIAIIAIVCLYAAINLVVAKTMNIKEMKVKYIDGQCTVGKIAANIFYLPAWFLKVAKIIIYYLVKYSDLLDEVEDRLISLLEGHHKTTTVITGEFSGTV